jgi:hypothetical protein
VKVLLLVFVICKLDRGVWSASGDRRSTPGGRSPVFVALVGWPCRTFLDTAKVLEFEPRSSPMVHALVTRGIHAVKITDKIHYIDKFIIPSQLYTFRAMFSPIIRSTLLYLQYLVVFTQVSALPDVVNTVKCS